MGKLKPRLILLTCSSNIVVKWEDRYLNPGPLVANILLSPKYHVVFVRKQFLAISERFICLLLLLAGLESRHIHL